MKKIIAFAAVVTAVAAFAAQEKQDPVAKPTKKGTAAAMARLADPNGKAGGYVVQPGTQKGSIGFLNAQTKFPASELEKVIATMQQMMKHQMVVKAVERKSGLPSLAEVEKAGVNVAIFAVDDPSLPALLAAPEERWALVNVARLGEGLKDDGPGKALLAGRFRGELQRAFLLACGGWASQYKGNLAVAVDLKGIDTVNPDALVGDVVPRYMNYLPLVGVTPARKVLYRIACHEGWAPEPKTDSQKRIWDEVHAMPKNPIVIEPEKAPAK